MFMTVSHREKLHLVRVRDFFIPKIEPVEVVRNSRGRWNHPMNPRNATSHETWQWLKALGFDQCFTFLIAPDDSPERLSLLANISNFEVVTPGEGNWFCWEITVNNNGQAIAVWLCPTTKPE